MLIFFRHFGKRHGLSGPFIVSKVSFGSVSPTSGPKRSSLRTTRKQTTYWCAKMARRNHMLDFVSGFVRTTVEYKGWGLNLLTVSFLATVFFNVLEAMSCMKQAGAIAAQKSRMSVSANMMAYFAVFHAVIGVYGVYANSLVAICSGGLTFFYLPILRAMKNIGGFTRAEKRTMFIFSLLLPAVIFLPWKTQISAVTFVGASFAFSQLPWQIWKEKSRGVVQMKLVLVYTASTMFWLFYAYTGGDMLFKTLTPVNLALCFATIVLWLEYPNRQDAKN
ncbi:MAG: hypothetical protein A3H69_05415 [Candidatus Sungbacteria bacterium RIFCSPLOWO2_02_FULL_47_9]|nr:MAG: hypothetical protein A3H69_05415 [Candidatus Sungbacteria bacterium RIFCSPLOWO2_02_FULL_47_9]